MTRTLAEVALEASTCTRCKLAGMGRTQVVFGVGNPDADLMFIGEAPGSHEDKQGEPFVGAAGQLLNRLLEGIGLAREDVYIANVLKSRPPGNRDPEPDEIEACTPWLVEQISIIQPRLIMTLGNFATKYVLQTAQGITRMRGTVHSWHGRTVIPTFHPAAILHGGGEKSPQFQDMREDFALVQRTLAGGVEPEPAEPSAVESAAEPSVATPAAEAPRVAPPPPAAQPVRATPGMAARPDRPVIVPAPPDEEQLELF
jgi:uracil-DNA glycosylase family 4